MRPAWCLLAACAAALRPPPCPRSAHVARDAALHAPHAGARLAALCLACGLAAAAPAGAADGGAIFEAKCAACHAGGGNIVARGKTLDRAALAANGVDGPAAVADVVSRGRRQMPGFGEACAPKAACTFGPRLDDAAVAAVAAWVDARADDGAWAR